LFFLSERQLLKAAYSLGASGTAEEAAEKVILRSAAPEGATDFAAVTASLKRCPDTNLAFFSSL